MKRMNANRLLWATGLMLATGAAQAHPGHGELGLQAGLMHPLGLDHLLAMVAVGAWSALALPARRAVLGPLVFMTGLLAGAVFGMSFGALSGVEPLVAASVLMFGALLAGARQWSLSGGLSMIGVAAMVHGLAHGAEWPLNASAESYVAGFMLTTVLLHAIGLAAGLMGRQASSRTWRIAGAVLGGAGLWLLAR